MFSNVEIDDQNTKYILPLDAIDLAFLHVNRQRDTEKTMPLWTLQNDNYYEIKVHASPQENYTEYPDPQNESLEKSYEKVNLKTYIKIITALSTKHRQKQPYHIRVIDEETLEIQVYNNYNIVDIDNQPVRISVQNFHGYNDVGQMTLCRLCRMMTGQKEMHKLDERHMELVMAPITDHHCIRQIDQLWSHCILCNEIIENKEFHVLCSLTHSSRLLDAINRSKKPSDNACNNVVRDYSATNNGASTANNKGMLRSVAINKEAPNYVTGNLVMSSYIASNYRALNYNAANNISSNKKASNYVNSNSSDVATNIGETNNKMSYNINKMSENKTGIHTKYLDADMIKNPVDQVVNITKVRPVHDSNFQTNKNHMTETAFCKICDIKLNPSYHTTHLNMCHPKKEMCKESKNLIKENSAAPKVTKLNVNYESFPKNKKFAENENTSAMIKVVSDKIQEFIAREKAKQRTLMTDEKLWSTRDVPVVKSSQVIAKSSTKNTGMAQVTTKKLSDVNIPNPHNKIENVKVENEVNDKIKKLITKRRANNENVKESFCDSVLNIKTNQTPKACKTDEDVLEPIIVSQHENISTNVESNTNSNVKVPLYFDLKHFEEVIKNGFDKRKSNLYSGDINKRIITDVDRKTAAEVDEETRKASDVWWFTSNDKDIPQEIKDQSDYGKNFIATKSYNYSLPKANKVYKVVEDKDKNENQISGANKLNIVVVNKTNRGTKNNERINTEQTEEHKQIIGKVNINKRINQEQHRNLVQDKISSAAVNGNTGKVGNDENTYQIKAEANNNEAKVNKHSPEVETVSKSSYKLNRRREYTSGESIDEFRRSLILKLVKK